MSGGVVVIGLGDSLTRPILGGMHLSSSSYLTFVNMRCVGPIGTEGKANLIFDGCQIDGPLISGIDGDPRDIEVRNCRVTNAIGGDSDLGIGVTNCVFDGGWVGITRDGTLRVHSCTFRGTSASAVRAWGDV